MNYYEEKMNVDVTFEEVAELERIRMLPKGVILDHETRTVRTITRTVPQAVVIKERLRHLVLNQRNTCYP